MSYETVPVDIFPAERERYIKAINGPRGFLSNYPDDVVMVVGGRFGYTVTKGDILDNKRRRQARRLAWKLRPTEPITKPCFVWVFDNGPIFPYGGSWLYVRTLKERWQLGPRHSRGWDFHADTGLTLKIMQMFPCGFLPMIENFGLWKRVFMETYHRPTRKRSESNGLALARAVISPEGHLIDVVRYEEVFNGRQKSNKR